MSALTFVGLGLGDRGVSLAGIEAIRDADVTYLEVYTSPSQPSRLISGLEMATGKRIQTVDRGFVESGTRLLDQASTSNVVLAVQGDPMIATTHTELRVRAKSRGIETRVVHGSTIPSAAASESGLHYYKFGPTMTFTRESASHHQDVYQRIHRNLLWGLHTLVLLEFDVEAGSGVEPGFVAQRLLEAEHNFKRGVMSDGMFALVLSRVGDPDRQAVWGGDLAAISGRDFGEPPHCIVVPGRLHFTESEALASLLGLSKDSIRDNADGIGRTAQVLVPRYVEKAKKALVTARTALKDRHPELLENADLYMRDAGGFLANEQDELAMLSIGYAEGLIDALSFLGEVKLEW